MDNSQTVFELAEMIMEMTDPGITEARKWQIEVNARFKAQSVLKDLRRARVK